MLVDLVITAILEGYVLVFTTIGAFKLLAWLKRKLNI